MKKMFYVATMMLLSVISANAQKLDGMWMLNNAGKEMLNLNDDDMDMDFILAFEGQDIVVAFLATVSEPEIGKIGFMMGTSGTFTRSGSTIKAKFNKEDTDFGITSMDLTDSDMKSLAATSEGEEMLKSMIENEAKKNMTDELKAIAEVSDLFTNMTIVSQTATKLVIRLNDYDGMELTFNKKG